MGRWFQRILLYGPMEFWAFLPQCWRSKRQIRPCLMFGQKDNSKPDEGMLGHSYPCFQTGLRFQVTAMAPENHRKQKNPRILCFHGFRTSGRILQEVNGRTQFSEISTSISLTLLFRPPENRTLSVSLIRRITSGTRLTRFVATKFWISLNSMLIIDTTLTLSEWMLFFFLLEIIVI